MVKFRVKCKKLKKQRIIYSTNYTSTILWRFKNCKNSEFWDFF